MCSVDIFASGLVEEVDDWENICQKAYTLDKEDFLDSGYPISSAMVPSSSNKKKLRSSQESLRKSVPNLRVTDSQESSTIIISCHLMMISKRRTMSRRRCNPRRTWEMLAWKHRSRNPLNCEDLQHPPCCHICPRRLDLRHLLDSLRKRRRKTLSHVVKHMAEFQKQTAEAMETVRRTTEASQRQTKVALAQMRASVADERQANAQMHKANMEWMRAESNKSHELMQMLMIGIEPIAQLSPATQSPPLRLEA